MEKHVHKKALVLILFTVTFIVTAEDVLQGTNEEIAHAEILWSSSNHWLNSYKDYSTSSSTGFMFLLQSGSDYARQELRKWYLSIADLPLPSTNSIYYSDWYYDRTEELASLAFRYTDVTYTSCLVRAAGYLHDIRMQRRSKEEVEAEGRVLMLGNGNEMTMESIGRGRAWFRGEESRQNMLKKMDSYLSEKIRTEFCIKGLLQLSEPIRSDLFGEIVRAAAFTQGEIDSVTGKVQFAVVPVAVPLMR